MIKMKQLRSIKSTKQNPNVSVCNGKGYIFNEFGILEFSTEIENGLYCKKALSAGLINKLEEDASKPTINMVDYKESLKINLSELKSFTNFVGKDKLRPAMQHICLKNNGNTYATDSYILQFKKHEYNLTEDLLIAPDVVKFFNCEVSVDIYENYIVFIGDEYTFYQHVEHARYPSCEYVIPMYEDHNITVNLKEIKESLKDCLFYTDKNTRSAKFEIKNGILTISAGDYSKQLQYIGHGDISIYFSVKLLNTYLKTIKSNDLNIKLTRPTHAGVLNDEFLLMPINN